MMTTGKLTFVLACLALFYVTAATANHSPSARLLLAAKEKITGVNATGTDVLVTAFDEDGDSHLDEHELEALLSALDLVPHDEHDDHGHDEEEEDEHSDHDDHDHDHGHEEEEEEGEHCHTADELLDEFDTNGNGKMGLSELEPVWQVLWDEMEHGACEPEETESSTTAAAWIGGIVASIVVTVVSGVLVVVLPAKNTAILGAMVSLGVGALLGDAFIHLIPAAFGLGHGHGAEGHDSHSDSSATAEENAYFGPACMILVGALVFFIFDKHMSSHRAGHDEGSNGSRGRARKPSDSESGDLLSSSFASGSVHRNSSSLSDTSSDDAGAASTGTRNTAVSSASSAKRGDAGFNHLVFIDTDKGYESFAHIHSTGWVNLLADGMHNFVDGVVIGSTFAVDFSAGIGSSIAILIHEVPAELGDFAVLRHSGFSFWGAFALNMLSGVTALVGTLIGLAVGTNLAALNVWILGFIAGAFIYLALGALVPELMKVKTMEATAIQTFFILLGMVIMILLTLVESALE